MSLHLVRTTTAIVFLAFTLAAAEGSLAQPAADIKLAVCDPSNLASGDPSLLASDSPLAAELPAGLAIAVLADEATEQWPTFVRGLVMTVRHLTLDPGVTSAMRQTQGPILFYVETGTVGFSINGQPSEVGEGSATLIELGQNYQLRNDDPANPATVLRLQIVPPGEETKVARGDLADVHDDEQAFSPGPPFIQSRPLLTADMPAVEGANHLIIACLFWTDPAVDPGDAVHPGAAAFLVLQGELLVGETGSLSAGECTVVQPQVAHRLRAGSSPPVVLVIATVPDGAAFWQAVAEGSRGQPQGRFPFSCDPQVEPDAIPDAAQEKPPSTAVRARL